MKKLISILCSGLILASVLSGCGTAAATTTAAAATTAKGADATVAATTAAGTTTKRIGISLVYKGDEWCAAVDEQFKTQAEALGYEVNIQDGNLDNETQVKQVENFITQKYDMIAVDPASADGIIPALQKARDAGIPVIIFDSPTSFEDIVSYISWDSYQTGQVIGKHLAELITKDYGGKANVAVLTMASPVAIGERVQGVKDALKDLDITYVAEQEYEGNREKAANVITNIKEPIDFVVAGQDNGAWGAVSALQAANNTTTKVFSMGAYGEESFGALQADTSNYKGTVAISPSTLVEATYKTITDYFAGVKDIPARTNIALDLVTHDNIDDYLSTH